MCPLQIFFFPVCGLSSDSLDIVFCRADVLILMKSSLSSISFMDHAFGGVVPKVIWEFIFLELYSSCILNLGL